MQDKTHDQEPHDERGPIPADGGDERPAGRDTSPATAPSADGKPEALRTIDAAVYTGDTEYLRTRIDPSRGERYVNAMTYIKPVPKDSENTYHNYKFASAAVIYEQIHEALARAGLEIRKRLNNEMDILDAISLAAGRSRNDRNGGQDRAPAPTMALDVSFALAAPKDGPDAVLFWERRIYYVSVRDIQSMQALWTYAIRYWVTDKFMMSTYDPSVEMDDRDDTDLDPDAVQRMNRRSQDRSRSRRNQPPPSEHIAQVHDHTTIIERGARELGLTDEELDDLHRSCNNDTGLVIKELSARVVAKRAAEAEVSSAAEVLQNGPKTAPPKAAPATGGGGPRPTPDDDGSGAADPRGDPPTEAPPHGEAPPERLTEAQLRKVIGEIGSAGIKTDTMQEIVRTKLSADKIANVTLDAIVAAASQAGLKLPTDTPAEDVLFAVIRDAAISIEDRKNREKETRSDGGAAHAAPTRPAEPAKPDGEPYIYDGMGDSSEKELRELNPEMAGKLAAERYPTPEARVDAFDAALSRERSKRAHETARATMTAGGKDRNEPVGAPAPPATEETAAGGGAHSGNGIEERIQALIKKQKLTKTEVSTLRGIARGDNRRLLEVLENFVNNQA